MAKSAATAQPVLSNALLAQLQPVITDAVNAALRAFFLGQKLGPNVFVVNPRKAHGGKFNPAVEWRAAMAGRYAEGSWNRDVIELIPFGIFEPKQIFHEAAARHPDREHPASGIANALKALVEDGVLAKAFRGHYAPAIDGVAIV